MYLSCILDFPIGCGIIWHTSSLSPTTSPSPSPFPNRGIYSSLQSPSPSLLRINKTSPTRFLMLAPPGARERETFTFPQVGRGMGFDGSCFPDKCIGKDWRGCRNPRPRKNIIKGKKRKPGLGIGVAFGERRIPISIFPGGGGWERWERWQRSRVGRRRKML